MYSCIVLYFAEIKMNWTELNAKIWNLGNAKLQTAVCGLPDAKHQQLIPDSLVNHLRKLLSFISKKE